MSNRRSSNPKGVIFDLDGTLADTAEDIAQGVRYAAQPFRDRDYEAAQIRPYVALGARRMLQSVTGCDEPHLLDQLVQRYRERYYRHSLDQTALFPEWPPVLDELVRLGSPLAVLSNKPDVATQPICNALLARWPFTAIAGLKDGVPAKPDPTSALDMCRLLQRTPQDVLLVGDSPFDMETALRGGLTPVGVAWGYQPGTELFSAGAQFLLEQAADLLQLVQ